MSGNQLCTTNFSIFRLNELLDFIPFSVAFITNVFSAIYPIFITIGMLPNGKNILMTAIGMLPDGENKLMTAADSSYNLS